MVSSVRFNFKTFFFITNFKTLKTFRSVKFTVLYYIYSYIVFKIRKIK